MFYHLFFFFYLFFPQKRCTIVHSNIVFIMWMRFSYMAPLGRRQKGESQHDEIR